MLSIDLLMLGHQTRFIIKSPVDSFEFLLASIPQETIEVKMTRKMNRDVTFIPQYGHVSIASGRRRVAECPASKK